MKELKPGDRIRAYYCLGGKPKGTVITVGSELITFKADEDGTQRQAHIKAVRRLRPKAPKPVEERLDPLTWWLTSLTVTRKDGSADTLTAQFAHTAGEKGSIYMQQIRPGEAVVNEAKVWDAIACRPGPALDSYSLYSHLCKALGLGDQK